MLKVKITGPAGSGKTMLAHKIYRMLQDEGYGGIELKTLEGELADQITILKIPYTIKDMLNDRLW